MNLMIQIYMTVCVVLLIFDIGFLLVKNMRNHRFYPRVPKFEEQILKEIEIRKETGAFSKEFQNDLLKKLPKIKYLIALQGVLEKNPEAKAWFKPAIFSCIEAYKRKADYEQAYYTYVISTPEEVEVSVTDEIEGNVKKNLRITNSGMSSAYIRAAITGNWVIPGGDEPSEDDVIVADWTDADGTFEWGDKIYTDAATAKANNGWYRHTDGYYYLLDPVAKGAQAETLFKTYTLTSSPVAGAVLDLTILVQAVLPADMPYAWPDIYNILNN